ncbi:hypothetical protein [Comamonas thiooxydans]|uniref:hypothetical protein n=1 Tax=Comamonas thiooxydans TaxID=363952 RepID=UPI001CBF37BA|nr:hypothetical protein [Comamonas thiooxydans]
MRGLEAGKARVPVAGEVDGCWGADAAGAMGPCCRVLSLRGQELRQMTVYRQTQGLAGGVLLQRWHQGLLRLMQAFKCSARPVRSDESICQIQVGNDISGDTVIVGNIAGLRDQQLQA